jgi:hypothetical protein
MANSTISHAKPTKRAWAVFGLVMALATAYSIVAFNDTWMAHLGLEWHAAGEPGKDMPLEARLAFLAPMIASAKVYAFKWCGGWLALFSAVGIAALLASATDRGAIRARLWLFYIASLMVGFLLLASSGALNQDSDARIFGAIGLLVFFAIPTLAGIVLRTAWRRRRSRQGAAPQRSAL